MLIGRDHELHQLTEMYNSKHFRLLVMYGRHRVGMTSLLREFAKKKNSVFFSAQPKNGRLNLTDFSEVLQQHFDKESRGSFADWEKAFAYLASKLGDKRFLLVIEDFHLLVAEHPALISQLQQAIDHYLRTKNIFIIICDPSTDFIENEILGYRSPLYGRITGQMLLMPLDYLDSSRFLPAYSPEDKLVSYAILGGIPCYADQFDDSIPIADNIARHILSGGVFLKDEPQVILRADFRETAVYNCILEAIACGHYRMSDVSRRIHEESQKCAKYLNTLRSSLLIDKITPIGDDETSRKSLYTVSDNYFRFWYRFIFRNKSFIELREPYEAAQEILESDSFGVFMSEAFRNICREYIVRKTIAGKLPFSPYIAGQWWSSRSKSKDCHNIDILAIDQERTCALFGSCKYDNVPFDATDYEKLCVSSRGFGKINEPYYYLFSKGGFSDEVKAIAKKNKNIHLIGIEDLFK